MFSSRTDGGRKPMGTVQQLETTIRIEMVVAAAMAAVCV